MIRLAEITVSFGEPMDMEHYRKSKPGREIYENIGKEVMTRIGELRDRAMG